MKAAMQESANAAASHSFLLDDDSTIPFSQEDVAAQLDDQAREEDGWGGGERGGSSPARQGTAPLHTRTRRPSACPPHPPHTHPSLSVTRLRVCRTCLARCPYPSSWQPSRASASWRAASTRRCRRQPDKGGSSSSSSARGAALPPAPLHACRATCVRAVLCNALERGRHSSAATPCSCCCCPRAPACKPFPAACCCKALAWGLARERVQQVISGPPPTRARRARRDAGRTPRRSAHPRSSGELRRGRHRGSGRRRQRCRRPHLCVAPVAPGTGLA